MPAEQLPPVPIALSSGGPAVRGQLLQVRVVLPVSRAVDLFVPVADGGIGPGICPAVLQGDCLDVFGTLSVQRLTTDADGSVVLQYEVPLDHPTDTLAMQVVVPTSRRVFLSEPLSLPVYDAGPQRFARPGHLVGPYSEALADLDRKTFHYTAPADAPAPPREPFAPLLGAFAVRDPAPPRVHTYTRWAEPGRTLHLIGDRMGEAPSVWMYGQTTDHDGTWVRAPLLHHDDTQVTAVVPPHLPPGMYLAWVQSEQGTSLPVRIGATDAWWVGPDRVAWGETASVYGRNLTYQRGEGGDASSVYLRPFGADASVSSVPVTVVEANPYKVTFEVPGGIAPGGYEVWVHNGHGGELGWSGPLALQVDQHPQLDWSGAVHTLQPSADLAPGLQLAIQSASRGDRVILPPGTFVLGSQVVVDRALSIEGHPSGTTLVVEEDPYWNTAEPGQATRPAMWFERFPARLQGVEIVNENRYFCQPNAPVCTAADGGGYGRTVTARPASGSQHPWGLVLHDVEISSPPGANYFDVYVSEVNGVHVTDSRFDAGRGVGVQVYRSRQVFVQDNAFTGAWDDAGESGAAAVRLEHVAEVDVSGNDAASVRADPPAASGLAVERLGRLVMVGGAAGAPGGMVRDLYIGQNVTHDLGSSGVTQGEQILFETVFTNGRARAVAWSDDTVRFAPSSGATSFFPVHDAYAEAGYVDRIPATSSPSILVIEQGRGAGQYRRILGHDGDTVTVDRPWDVPPDSTSVFSLNNGAYQTVVYDNTLSGSVPAASDGHALGVVLYGSHHDAVVARNTMSQLGWGVMVSSLASYDATAPLPVEVQMDQGLSSHALVSVSGVVVEDNLITEVRKHGVEVSSRILPATAYTSPDPITMWDISVRDNEVEALEAAVFVGDTNLGTQGWPHQRTTTIEHNQLTADETVCLLSRAQSHTVFRHNDLYGTGSTVGFEQWQPGSLEPLLYDSNQAMGLGDLHTDQLLQPQTYTAPFDPYP